LLMYECIFNSKREKIKMMKYVYYDKILVNLSNQ